MENTAEKIALEHCRLGYVDKTGNLEILSVLDLSRKDEIKWIECGHTFVALKNSGFGRWDTVMHREKPLLTKGRVSLPLVGGLADCFVNRFKFKQTVRLLRAHGVDADDWLEGWYWSCEELGYDGNQIHTFEMSSGAYSVHDRLDTNGFVRYALL